jgi:hypothetical protein
MNSRMTRELKYRIIPMLFVLIVAVTGCNDEVVNPINPENCGDFELKASYDSIRSCQGGGGSFVLYINPGKDFRGTINLSLQSDHCLHAILSKSTLCRADSVCEILIKPDTLTSVSSYLLEVTASNAMFSHTIHLRANIIDWDYYEDIESLGKKEQFKNWFITQNPKYGTAFSTPFLSYETYPQIIIVKHMTYLTKDWEIRLCYHVMIDPYDWAIMRIRNRNSPEPEIAAKRGIDGIIRPIPISEYPVLFGY